MSVQYSTRLVRGWLVHSQIRGMCVLMLFRPQEIRVNAADACASLSCGRKYIRSTSLCAAGESGGGSRQGESRCSSRLVRGCFVQNRILRDVGMLFVPRSHGRIQYSTVQRSNINQCSTVQYNIDLPTVQYCLILAWEL